MKTEKLRELLTEIRRHNSSGLTKDMQGRIDAALSRQDEREIIGVERYRVVRFSGNFGIACVRAGDGERKLFQGHINDCERVAVELAAAFEDGKFVATRPAQTEQQPVAYFKTSSPTPVRVRVEFCAHEKWMTDEDTGVNCMLDGGWSPLYAAPIAQTALQSEFGDAYQGTREDLAIWKRRALEAEQKVRQQEQIIDHLTLEAQGETRMGEPVIPQTAPQPEQSGLVEALEEIASGLQAEYAWEVAEQTLAAYRAALSSQRGEQ